MMVTMFTDVQGADLLRDTYMARRTEGNIVTVVTIVTTRVSGTIVTIVT